MINSAVATFNDLSPIFRFHLLHITDNDLFHENISHGTNNTGEKDTSQNWPFFEEDAFNSGKERGSAFQKAKRLLCGNVKVLQKQCFNIKGDVLFVQEINKKVQELMDSLAANLSQNLDLVERDSPKKQKVEHSSITYESLLQS